MATVPFQIQIPFPAMAASSTASYVWTNPGPGQINVRQPSFWQPNLRSTGLLDSFQPSFIPAGTVGLSFTIAPNYYVTVTSGFPGTYTIPFPGTFTANFASAAASAAGTIFWDVDMDVPVAAAMAAFMA